MAPGDDFKLKDGTKANLAQYTVREIKMPDGSGILVEFKCTPVNQRGRLSIRLEMDVLGHFDDWGIGAI